MKYSFASVYIFLCIFIGACSQSNSGFKSPEAVVNFFVQNIKKGNFNNAIKTSVNYYDDIVQKINVKEQFKRLNVIGISLITDLPSEYHSILKMKLLGNHARNIQMFTVCLLLPGEFNDYLDGKMMNLSNNEFLIDKFISSLRDIQKLNTLEVVRMDISYPEIQFSDSHKEFIERQKIVYGFDERVEYVVLYKYNNEYYTGGFMLDRYGKDWYISSFSTFLALTNANGTLEKVSGIEEYLYEYDIKK